MKAKIKVSNEKFVELLKQQGEIIDIELEQDFNNDIPGLSTSKSVKIIGCNFKLLIFPDFSYANLEFIDCEIGNLIIKSNHNGKLGLLNCHLKGLSILNRSVSHLEIIETKIDEGITLSECTINHLTIVESTFSNLEIFDSKNPVNLDFRGSPSILHKVQSIQGTGPFATITIDSINVHKLDFKQIKNISQVRLKNSEIDECFFQFEPHTHSVVLENIISPVFVEFRGQAGSYGVTGGCFNKLKILNPSGTITISGGEDEAMPMKIGILDLSGGKNISNINLIRLFLKRILLDNITVDKFRVRDLEIQELFSLEYSKLQNGEFHNVDLSNAEIKMIDCTLTGSEMINVQWPKGYEFYSYKKERKQKTIKENLKLLWSLKETYRQMKVLSLAQHNKIDALYFQKQELNAFWRIIKIKTFREAFTQNIGNLFILGTNKIFSDFGQNIWRPLIWLFVVHVIFFNCLLIKYFNIYPFLFGINNEITWASFNAFFTTLLPTHGTDLKIGHMKKDVGGLIDFLMRIFSAYFIFYFVHSSRKYHQ